MKKISRMAKAGAALALAAGALLPLAVTGTASADPNPNNHGSSPQWIRLSTSSHARVFGDPTQNYPSGTVLSNGDYVWADCWVAGDYVGTAGNVWYHTTYVYQYGTVTGVGSSWTFAPYVDAAAAFHNVPGVPHC
ncbi:hypothetical protein ABT095_21145 [Kitasatospora sp. NPDC002227]|uniref:hypothetical protein n=1 Tax=Kitasatospora sp. NPDC002227 TaxID=3154773 RepID=UPI00331CD6A2